MSKKVIALSGTKRKKNTYSVIKQIEDILKDNDIEIEIISLYDYNIKDCLGCQNCIYGRKCPLDDDVQKIKNKILSSDGIIIGSPVYMCSISGKLKNFIDRTADWFHRPQAIGKPVLLIVTTAGSYANDALNYLENISMHWGCAITNKISRKQTNLSKNILYKDIKLFIDTINKGSNCYKPLFKHIVCFNVQKILANKILENDRIYWIDNGLNKRDFYFDCKISIPKTILGRIIYSILNILIKKNQDERCYNI